MLYIETKDTGKATYNNFSADYSEGQMFFNGITMPVGKITHDIISLPLEFVKELFYKGDNLYNLLSEWYLNGHTTELFKQIGERMRDILNYIKDTEPFKYFDVKGEFKAFDNIFNDVAYKNYEASFHKLGTYIPKELPRKSKLYGYLQSFYLIAFSYVFIAADTLNFYSVANMFYINLTDNDKFSKAEIADFVNEFFNNSDTIKFIEDTNHTKDLTNFTLHPTLSVGPVVIKNDDGYAIGKRMNFNRMLDFYVHDMFEGLSFGHSSRQCKLCKKYFFMTSGHHQLYCSTVNEDYGYPCAYVAKNKKQMPKQKKADGFGYDIWKKRCNSIRREKSLTNKKAPTAKYSIAVCDKAKQLADRYFEMAQIDFEYAKSQYEKDMELKHLFAEAKK